VGVRTDNIINDLPLLLTSFADSHPRSKLSLLNRWNFSLSHGFHEQAYKLFANTLLNVNTTSQRKFTFAVMFLLFQLLLGCGGAKGSAGLNS